MRTVVLAALALAPLLTAPSAQAEPRIAEVLAAIKDPAVRAYVVGLADGISWANAQAGRKGGSDIYCPPATLGITDDQYVSIFTRYAASKNEPRDFAGNSMLRALIDAFPCPPTAPR